MPPDSEQAARAAYASEIEIAIARIRSEHPRIHIPDRNDLYSKHFKAPFHPYPEVFIQTGGATEFTCPGSHFTMTRGEFCVMPRGLPHAERPIDQNEPYGVCVVGISMGRLFCIRGHARPPGTIRSYGYTLLEQTPGHEAARFLDDISEHGSLPEQNRQAYARSLLEVFFLRTDAALRLPTATNCERLPRLIEATMSYTRIHLSDSKLSVKGIAEALGCSADHLSRQFHRTKAIHLIKWIARERIELAKYLLDTSKQNVAEIGWACGFNTSSYFIRTFKHYTGLTPKAYRSRAHLSSHRD